MTTTKCWCTTLQKRQNFLNIDYLVVFVLRSLDNYKLLSWKQLLLLIIIWTLAKKESTEKATEKGGRDSRSNTHQHNTSTMNNCVCVVCWPLVNVWPLSSAQHTDSDGRDTLKTASFMHLLTKSRNSIISTTTLLKTKSLVVQLLGKCSLS